jgi:eukaryotic-like serine/threonine-protein kinase
LEKRFPLDLRVNGYWLPMIRAAIDLNRANSARAIEILERTEPFDLYPVGNLYAIYLRGLDAGISTQSALAHLGLARAYALAAQSASGPDADAMRCKARAAYQDSLTLWKDADPDIPVLKQAKAEYAKLQ